MDPELDVRFEAEYYPRDVKTGHLSEHPSVRPLPGANVTAVRIDPKPFIMLRIGR